MQKQAARTGQKFLSFVLYATNIFSDNTNKH